MHKNNISTFSSTTNICFARHNKVRNDASCPLHWIIVSLLSLNG